MSAARSIVLATALAAAGCDASGGDGEGAVDAGASSDGAASPDGGGLAGPTRYPAGVVASPVTAAVADRLRAIAAAGPAQRDDVFMKVGASGTVSRNLLFCFAGPEHQPGYLLALDGRDHLMPTIEHFRAGRIAGATPFDRVTEAAEVGRTARWALTGAPSPLDLELAAATPRFALVNYGTNDMGAAASYGAALAPFWQAMGELLDRLEADGVVPIVTGLNPRADLVGAARWVPTWDAVTRALAESRQVPYLSLVVASSSLDDLGLLGDGLHGNVLVDDGAEPCVFTAAGLAFNYNVRNLASIEALDTVRAIVVDDAPAPDAPVLPPIAGAGTHADPFVVDRLPFSHSFATGGGERVLDTYPGCSSQDESGPEIVYRLELPAGAAVRAVVLDRDAVDVDLHVLTGDACVERADQLVDRPLAVGAHTIVVDTFVSGGVEHAGAYTLVMLACEPGDPACQ